MAILKILFFKNEKTEPLRSSIDYTLHTVTLSAQSLNTATPKKTPRQKKETTLIEKITLPFGFECSENYFNDYYKSGALSFHKESLSQPNTPNIIHQKIGQWQIAYQQKNATREIINWYSYCKQWLSMQEKEHQQNLYQTDKQIFTSTDKDLSTDPNLPHRFTKKIR